MTRIFSEENPLLWMLMTVKAARGSAGRSGAVGKPLVPAPSCANLMPVMVAARAQTYPRHEGAT
jgi:hypothetical protein